MNGCFHLTNLQCYGTLLDENQKGVKKKNQTKNCNGFSLIAEENTDEETEEYLTIMAQSPRD